MKVLVIYSNDSKEKVAVLREEIAARYGSASVLRLHSSTRKKSIIRHAWHKDAKEMMKCADLIVYAVSTNSSTNKNVEWELRTALKLEKCIVCLPMEPNVTPENPCLFVIDKHTKEKVPLAEMLEAKEQLFEIIDGFNADKHIRLFHKEVDPTVLLEQYKIFSQTAENLMNRRQTVNSFFVSANTALLTIAATVFALGSEGDFLSKLIVVLALSVPGLFLNISWRRTLHSYYINNKGKMKILSMIEKRLAADLYDAEWKAMKNKFSKQKYISFTDNEKWISYIFLYFYIAVAVACCIAIALLSIFR